MSLITNWGYTLTELSELPAMFNEETFNEMTASKYAGDERIPSNIQAAESAIRNYCGWHLYPSTECRLSTTLFDKRVTAVGAGFLIQLPARFVSAVSSVSIAGVECSTFVLETNGILRLYDVATWLPPQSAVVITYTAGLPDGFMSPIEDIIAHRVTHALANSYGVTSESAGGVSVTYNANWINSSRATALPSDNKEVLEPYKLTGVF